MKVKVARIFKELVHHLPYSAVGVAACLGLLLGIEKVGWRPNPDIFFHIMHPAHILLSAMVTTAMYWKHHPQWLKAGFVGLIGTLPICALSDIGIPYLGSLLFGTPVQFHLCIIEEPLLVLSANFSGIFLGILFLRFMEKGTEMTHLLHVLFSSLASLLYLVIFNFNFWENFTFLAFAITLVAVWIPCCLSDIVVPLLFLKGEHVPCCGHHPHEM